MDSKHSNLVIIDFSKSQTQMLSHYLLFVDHEHMNYEIFQRHFSMSLMGNVSWLENRYMHFDKKITPLWTGGNNPFLLNTM